MRYFRLVSQIHTLHTMAGGAEVRHEIVRYALQVRYGYGPWKTVPTVEFDDLTVAEKTEIAKSAGKR